ncbi:hypothetical protein HELRODRAFT_167001 [Helobdella robusta]|uniref:Uncharacterized protein n=1 Tax=Helobdella robusta TaxID=6412 RepID=T1EYV5_HELRO|nr:hypothetical protein HELRODRAFT_167001 [Helobdella robusta]ESO11908.1 hypothetical protein HELRODRAFT_167001 [Helobdella robusta]
MFALIKLLWNSSYRSQLKMCPTVTPGDAHTHPFTYCFQPIPQYRAGGKISTAFISLFTLVIVKSRVPPGACVEASTCCLYQKTFINVLNENLYSSLPENQNKAIILPKLKNVGSRAFKTIDFVSVSLLALLDFEATFNTVSCKLVLVRLAASYGVGGKSKKFGCYADANYGDHSCIGKQTPASQTSDDLLLSLAGKLSGLLEV